MISRSDRVGPRSWYWPNRYKLVVIVAVLVLWVAAMAVLEGGGPRSVGAAPTTSIPSRVTPTTPLGTQACVSPMHGRGISGAAAGASCAASRTAPWFHATLTNASAGSGYVRCAFTAWDSHGGQVFYGFLPLGAASPRAGVYLRHHQTRSITGFFDPGRFPQAIGHAHGIARYTAYCTRRPNPPIG